MTQPIFITGTDTDVGKSTISAALCYAIQQASHSPSYYKPVLSGACYEDGLLKGGDAELVREILAANAENHPPLDSISEIHCSYLFEEAVSPHLAAQRLGISIDLKLLASDYARMSAANPHLVVEGAGGAACPLSFDSAAAEAFTMANLMESLNIPVVVVCRAALGTLHHTVATIAYLRQFDLCLKGLIVNGAEDDFICEDNIKMLEAMTSLPILAVFPKLKSPCTAEHIKAAVDSQWQTAELVRRIFE